MPMRSAPWRAFFAELRRRKVWRTVAVYAVVALGITEAADIFFPRLLLPDWTVTLVVALAVLGFPAAVALSWLYVVVPDTGPPAPGESEDAIGGAAIAPFQAAADRRPAVVVLPFDNMSPDPADAYFSDGLTEEIITDLSGVRGVRVISRNSAMVLKAAQKDTRTIGRELAVGYVLEGSVRKAGDSLRITAQLIDARTDTHLWAKRYDGLLEDVFAMQEQVSRSIVKALGVHLSPDEHDRLGERRIDDVRAYQSYLKAVAVFWQMGGPDNIAEATTHLEDALGVVGPNPYLYAGLAWAHWHRVNMGLAHEETIRQLDESVANALALEPESPVAWAVRGVREIAFAGDLRAGMSSLMRALRGNPDELTALAFLATVYVNMLGRPEPATALVARLRSIDPLNPQTNWLLGALPFFQGRYAEAVPHWRRLTEWVPDGRMYAFYHAWALAYAGRTDEARRVLDEAARLEGDDVTARFCAMLDGALRHDRDGVLAQLTPEFRRTVARDGSWAHIAAAPLAFAGAVDEAIALLRGAMTTGFVHYPMMAEFDPFLVRLRGEPRYEELLREVEQSWNDFADLVPVPASTSGRAPVVLSASDNAVAVGAERM